MKIFDSIQNFNSQKQTIVTIGTFDGIHLGHQKILRQIRKNAEELNCESLVLTFFPHPKSILQLNTEMKQINTLEEKIELLKKNGIDNLVIHPFDKEFSRLTAEEFVEKVLVDAFNVRKIIIGYDHRFGRNRTADINDLIEFGKVYNFEVEQISAEEINEVSISSTKIRKALEEGDIGLANRYLGYNFFITGTVKEGEKLGRTIGYPTANINIPEEYKIIPLNGVYIVEGTVEEKFLKGMMNIGTNPTVGGEKQSLEVHFFDFDQDIYNKRVSISFLKRIRSEQKFESVDALKNQLYSDKMTALEYFKALV